MKRRKLTIACLVVVFGFILAPPSRVQSQQEADALFQAQDWAKAAQAYQAITQSEPANGRAWYRLGYALHALGKYDRSVEAFQKTLTINGNNSHAMYNLACGYARLNQKDKAFEWLNKALNARFNQPAFVKTDEDLASLRDDARFREVAALADRLAQPCIHSPQHKQFDFWIGEWDVQAQGQLAGTNSVQRILDGCVIFENWTGSRGGTGKSFNFYNSSTGKWQQVWVDNTGNVLQLYGEYKDNEMRYTGETVGQNGNKTLHRLTFFNLAPDRVRQFWETSTDGGKTWNVVFDGMYARKK